MSKKLFLETTVVVIMVSLSAMIGTAEARPLRGLERTSGVFEQAWQWLAQLWPGGAGDQEKYGGGIDPNGQPAPPAPYGAGIDPDGASATQGGQASNGQS